MPCDYAQTGDKWKLLGDHLEKLNVTKSDSAAFTKLIQGADAGDVMWFGVTKECSDGCEPQPLDKSDCAIVRAIPVPHKSGSNLRWRRIQSSQGSCVAPGLTRCWIPSYERA